MQKYKVIWLVEEKRLNAAEAGRQVGMNERVAQRLAKKKKRGPKPALLEEAHKDHVTRFIDDNSTATVTDVMNSLTAAFKDLKINKTIVNREDAIEKRYTWATEMVTTDMDFLKNCVFIDESAFSINLKRTCGWARKGGTPVATVSVTRSKTTIIIGAISAKKRRLRDSHASSPCTGTNTNNCICFLIFLMDILDQFPQMKGFYLVMDIAPIHTSKTIEKLVVSGGYRCAYLPSYSPELNPIEQFWASVKGKIRRHKLLDAETLSSTITETCQQVKTKDLEGFIGYSASRIVDCVNRNPM
ncbi:hypothetical protein [Parasitella parasitica]|uniref:Tc1-like transposase DDE domain-containing protein n=1 Tax=Parasitella parasitica TaxID=35722 RepID=A0A0B7MQN3_9FUNG|nr:hypothetical protein [Parasitella parasitica]